MATAFKNIILMGSSTALRIGSGLISFSVLARLLGPEKFGQLMLWFSVATLIGLVANFGSTPYMLKEVASKQAKVGVLVGEILMSKLLIYSSLLVLLILSVWLFVSADERSILMLLSLAMLFEALTEFFNAGYRAVNSFAKETRIASYGAVIQLVLVLILVSWQSTVLMAALTFMLSRLIILSITWFSQYEDFSGFRLGSFHAGIRHLRSSSMYAADFFLQSLMGQLDSILLNQMLGLTAVGLYQAGMRVFQSCAQSANILANVFIPRLANSNQSNDSRNVQLAFVFVGTVLGLFMVLAAQNLTDWIFGEKYDALNALFPWFGLLFFTRFCAASYGVILTATGFQTYRTYANVALWLSVLFFAYQWVPDYALQGWLMALIAGHVVLFVLYFLRVFRQAQVYVESLALITIAAIVFSFLLPVR